MDTEILELENKRCSTCLKLFSEHRKISIDQYICTDEGYKSYWRRRAIEYPYAVVIGNEQLKKAKIKMLKI